MFGDFELYFIYKLFARQNPALPPKSKETEAAERLKAAGFAIACIRKAPSPEWIAQAAIDASSTIKIPPDLPNKDRPLGSFVLTTEDDGGIGGQTLLDAYQTYSIFRYDQIFNDESPDITVFKIWAVAYPSIVKAILQWAEWYTSKYATYPTEEVINEALAHMELVKAS